MGFWNSNLDSKMRGTVKKVNSSLHKELLKTFSFTGIGGGSGASTILLYLAQYLSIEEKKQVIVVDMNFLQPDLLYNMDVDVTTENTILNYIKGKKRLEDCFLQDATNKRLHLLTASPKDDISLLMSIKTDAKVIENIIGQLEMFDYILINLPYMQPFVTFLEPIDVIDKGYIVLDERLSALNKTQNALDFIHRYKAKSRNFNNIILNKRTKHDYPYEKIVDELQCNLITEIPFDEELIHIGNSKQVYLDKVTNTQIQMSIGDILESIKS